MKTRVIWLALAGVTLTLNIQTLAGDATVDSACFKGEPRSELFEVDDVLEDKGYVVGFSRETRTPLWVCYRLDGETTTHKLTRPKGKTFNQFKDGDFAVRHSDYTHSGYDRGHMAPSSGIGKFFGKAAQLGTFRTTNICPQHPGLNQRCWERFEKQVADYYADKMDEVWIVTGPIFGESCVELESNIRVPQAFYKIVVAKIDGQVEMLGIVMPNERTEASKIYRFIKTVDEIEEFTGIDFFHELDDDVEETAEAEGSLDNRVHSDWGVSWELRPLFDGRERTIRTRECE